VCDWLRASFSISHVCSTHCSTQTVSMEEVLFFSQGLPQLKNVFSPSMALSTTANDSSPPHLKCSLSRLCYLNGYAIITIKHDEDHTSLVNSLPMHAYMRLQHTITSSLHNWDDFIQSQVPTKVHVKQHIGLLSLDYVRGVTACHGISQI